MLDLIKLRKKHGLQAIKDLRSAAVINTFRGFPVLDESKLNGNEQDLINLCPAGALSSSPFSLDLGKCTFCGECERVSGGAVRFTPEHKLASTNRNHLILTSGKVFNEYVKNAVEARKEIHRLFGRSLKLRQVSAAGCNGCELELNASGNVNFDMGRFGIDFVASPRHADGIVLTGPISKNMAPALNDTYRSISEPKIVIAFGTCAISGGIFALSDQINRAFLDEIKVDLFIPGNPPHPLTFINGLLDFLGRE